MHTFNKDDIEFEWNGLKAGWNRRKHGVAFEEAATVFADPEAGLYFDPDHSEDEDRYLLLGMSAKGRLLVVSHCYRRGESRIRIISARKATASEAVEHRKGIT